MENKGVVIHLNTQFTNRPNLNYLAICDFETKKLSLVAVDPSLQGGLQIVVNEVQDYTVAGQR
jgi:hypothetical protein